MDIHKQLSEEMGRAPFADKRLCRRLAAIVARLGSHSAQSFPQALVTSAELEAAYRFFSNPLVTANTILSGHFDGVRRRAIEQSCSLVIHDTTTFRFRKDGERVGLGRTAKTGQAFFGHFALVLSDDGTRRPLGMAGIETWARGADAPNGAEHGRWWRLVEESAKRLEGASLVHVMDREADDYLLFIALIEGAHRFVIRSMHNRQLAPPSTSKLDEVVAVIERSVERNVSLSKRTKNRNPIQQKIHPSRERRTTKLAIGATATALRKPRLRSLESAERKISPANAIDVNVVRVWELDPPEGETPVEWVLLTNEPIDSVEQIVRIVDCYRARWTIEEYFKALKSGCAYEARQLGDYESLVNALAVFAPIACNLLCIRNEARRAPEGAGTPLLSSEQLDVLRALGTQPLPEFPTTREVMLCIAALGGHIKYAPDPGWITLARGYSRLLLMAEGWNAAKLQPVYDQR